MKPTLQLASASALILSSHIAVAQADRAERAPTDSRSVSVVIEEREIQVIGNRVLAALDEPQPISLMSAEQRNLTGIGGARDLVMAQPGFNFTSNYGISARGIGRQTEQTLLGQENSVIQYVDGFLNLVPSNIAESTLFGGNLLFTRGPAGTRYGRNSLAGAINVLSRAPTAEFTGQIQLGLTRGVGYNAGFNIAGPVTDNFGYRVGFQRYRTPSISKNLGGPSGAGFATDNIYLELQLEWTIGPFHIRNRATHFTYDNQPAYPQISRYNNGVDGNGGTVFGALSPNPQYGYTGQAPAGRNEISVNAAGFDRLRSNFQDIVNADLDLDFAKLYYVGGYQQYVSTGAADQDLTPRPSYDGDTVAPGTFAPGTQVPTDYQTNYHNDNYFFSHELRLEGNSNDKLEWIVGLYYFKQKFDEQYWESITNAQEVLGHPILGTDAGTLAAPNPRNATFAQRNIYTIDSKAIFGNVTFNLGNGVRLDAGLRHTWDHKDALTDFRYVYFYPPFYASDVSPDPHGARTRRSDRGLSGRASLAWEFQPGYQIYAAYSRGYNSSAFTLGQGLPPNNVADSTFLDVYEIGGFATFGRLRLDGSVFYQKLHNLQVPISTREIVQGPNGPQLGIVYSRFDNARQSEIYGAEAELRWQPNPESNIVLSYTYLHPTFRSFCPTTADPAICGAVDISEPALLADGVTPNPLFQAPQNLSGNEIPRTPRHKVSLYGYYGIDLGRAGHLYPGGSVYYQSGFYISPFELDRFHIGSRVVAGATLTYRTANDRLDITGSVTNLFREVYTDTASLTAFGTGPVSQTFYPGADRTWNLTARYRF